MLHLHASYNFHFYAIFLFLQFTFPVCRRSPLAPLLHQRRLAVVTPSLYVYSLQDRGVDEWREADCIVRHAEVEHP